MKERFEVPGQRVLIAALLRHDIVNGNEELANAFIAQGTLVEFQKGQGVINEGACDNDIFLLIAGTVGIVVSGSEIATRKAGQFVGEMAAIEPSQPRSATDESTPLADRVRPACDQVRQIVQNLGVRTLVAQRVFRSGGYLRKYEALKS
jgi:hypothetical protein